MDTVIANPPSTCYSFYLILLIVLPIFTQISEGNNFVPGTNPFTLDGVGWIHEESSFIGRCMSHCAAGFRGIKYVQHSGPPPGSIMNENKSWFSCQCDETTSGLSDEDMKANIVATHEKGSSCGVFCCWVPCVCNCFGLPYLTTKDGSTGTTLGTTKYVCDLCCFIPKYDILDASDKKMYHLRPDTCFLGCCPRCRCGGDKGKCCRIPFILRNPSTLEPIKSGATKNGKDVNSMVDVLWSGWANECCSQKNAYHVTFPNNVSAAEKAVLVGSTLLVDVTMFEQEGDDN